MSRKKVIRWDVIRSAAIAPTTAVRDWHKPESEEARGKALQKAASA